MMKMLALRRIPGGLILLYFIYVLHTCHEDVELQMSLRRALLLYCVYALHTVCEDVALQNNTRRAHSIEFDMT